MTTVVRLPAGQRYRIRGADPPATDPAPPCSRIAYAAAHVVADPRAAQPPGATAATLDWDATLAFRRHLWSHGLGVAEAMDTAQRGAGLDHRAARELIRRSSREARACGGRIVAGVATDQLGAAASVADVERAYLEQLGEVSDAGATPVLMCSRQLAACARRPDDYREVYGEVLRQAGGPVILHWLGPAFDPGLTGYWGSSDVDEATEVLLDVVNAHAGTVTGVKLSLLDAAREVALRRRLPAGVHLYTGDDHHYLDLIRGDAGGYSDALLGAFDAIAPVAAAALRRLDAGDVAGYDRTLAPTVPVSRHLFSAPTAMYRTGLVFLAWLAGHQDHFVMVGGFQTGRDPMHLARLLRLADAAGLLPDPELAASRARAWFTVAGVGQ